jgi:hypothetical protein
MDSFRFIFVNACFSPTLRSTGLLVSALALSVAAPPAIAPYCTYQTPEYFFSYRREKQKKVQWSGIVSVTSA